MSGVAVCHPCPYGGAATESRSRTCQVTLIKYPTGHVSEQLQLHSARSKIQGENKAWFYAHPGDPPSFQTIEQFGDSPCALPSPYEAAQSTCPHSPVFAGDDATDQELLEVVQVSLGPLRLATCSVWFTCPHVRVRHPCPAQHHWRGRPLQRPCSETSPSIVCNPNPYSHLFL